MAIEKSGRLRPEVREAGRAFGQGRAVSRRFPFRHDLGRPPAGPLQILFGPQRRPVDGDNLAPISSPNWSATNRTIWSAVTCSPSSPIALRTMSTRVMP